MTFDPEKYFRKAEQFFECSVEHFVHAKRLSGCEKEIQDMKYISILRGINVSGQKKIKMTDLKSLYDLLDFTL
jgi:predicted RecB family nuclease